MSILYQDLRTALSAQLKKDLVDDRVESGQFEWLVKHSRLYALKEKLDCRIIFMTGKEDEALTCSRSDARHRPIKHLAAHLRHHHIAKNEIETRLHDFTQALNAARDRRDPIRAGD